MEGVIGWWVCSGGVDYGYPLRWGGVGGMYVSLFSGEGLDVMGSGSCSTEYVVTCRSSMEFLWVLYEYYCRGW